MNLVLFDQTNDNQALFGSITGNHILMEIHNIQL